MADVDEPDSDSLDQVVALVGHFQRTGDRRPLDSGVGICRAVLSTGPAAEHVRTTWESTLRLTLVLRWNAFRDRRDLDESIELGHRLVVRRTVREQDLRLLGRMLADRFELDRDQADMEAAIEVLRRAAAMPEDGTNQPSATLDTLSSLLLERARTTGSTADLAEAERSQRHALSLLGDAPENARDIEALRTNLASTLQLALKFHRSPAVAHEAVGLLHTVLAGMSADSPRRTTALLHLATASFALAELTGDAADIEAMITAGRAALAAVPRGRPAHARALAELGVALRLASEHTEDTALLDESVALLREAVESTAPDDPLRPQRLNSLGNALHRLGERTGDAALLDQSVEILRTAVAGRSPELPDHFGRLTNLAVALRERFHQTGDLAALREAAELARLAPSFPHFPHQSAQQLANLGVVLQTWYDRTADPGTALEAVETARQVLALTPEGSPERAKHLNHLGNALHKRFLSDGDPADLDESAEALDLAVEGTAYGSPEHASHLHNLGLTLLSAARLYEDPALVARAVSTLGRAVWASATGTAHAAEYLQSYASGLRTLHLASEDPAVLRAAEDAYRQVARIEALPAARRVLAACDWGAAAADGGRWEEALEGFELALALLPFSITRRLARDDQEHGLLSVQGLAADAAACAVRLGRLDHAVLLLEQGRGVLLGQAIAERAEWERLRAEHPLTAERFAHLRQLIELTDSDTAADTSGGPDGSDPAGIADLRHTLAGRWEQLVTEIRTLPGFEGFLGAPTYAEVLACAEDGPVVVMYSSVYGSDALVVRPDGVTPVPLTGVTPEALEEQVTRLRAALDAATVPGRERAAQDAVGEVLAWTWDRAAEPVLGRLGLLDPPADGAWPRLWWSPGGALAALPLHAAGHHEELPDLQARTDPLAPTAPRPRTGSRPRAVLDLVVSSYTPTVRALAYARARAATPSPPGGLLAVVVPDAPGTRPLGGVRREVRELRALFPVPGVLAGPRATRGNVLGVLPAHPYVHFACHGVSDPENPSRARLLVHDHQEHPLTVRHLSRLELPNARLAVLSACDTARGSDLLADEAIHITSAFQIAGYPHTIGTLWPVHDAVAVRVTRSLYRQLRTGVPAASLALDTDRAALALHHAVRQCRTAFRNSPSLWAAHVHSGA
ncbi:CHAT domain-containing tetratricopeptide repeat protein [Streptomyces sp. LaPpAH-108]|uniref:CHAT domain-containing tetratricopeptide repeat protein n=1 Tax=Streptomyces sp. LaPpAH-108 TaxID=1155714 RepID=UPI00035D2D5B|nr:CHAT domain-containing protein [Streptomyces sp. LaPpAH-108]